MDLFTGLIYGFIVALAYGVGEFVGIRKRERELSLIHISEPTRPY